MQILRDKNGKPPRRKARTDACHIGPRRRDCPLNSSSSGRSLDRASCRPQRRQCLGAISSIAGLADIKPQSG